MGKVLYTAVNHQGKEKSGFIDVQSNKEALSKLKNLGLENIVLHGDAAIGVQREDLNWISEKRLNDIATYEVQQQKGLNFFSYLGEVFKSSIPTTLIGGAIFYYGYSDSPIWMAAGVIVASFVPFFSLYSYSTMNDFNNLLKASAFGEWERVQELSKVLKSKNNNIDLTIEADTREAAIFAYKKDMDSAINFILPHREYLSKTTPGMFESKLASLYHMAGKYDKYIENMKKAYEVSKQNSLRCDWAMAEARLGNLEVARGLIKEIEIESLPSYGMPLMYYTKGVVAYRKGELEYAYEQLSLAYNGFLEYSKNPAVWSALAIIVGMFAIVIHDLNGEQDGSYLLSEAMVDIIKVQADKPLIVELDKRFPKLFVDND
jgi:tetratricopeptide (TPR) repeat protein